MIAVKAACADEGALITTSAMPPADASGFSKALYGNANDFTILITDNTVGSCDWISRSFCAWDNSGMDSVLSYNMLVGPTRLVFSPVDINLPGLHIFYVKAAGYISGGASMPLDENYGPYVLE